MSDFKVGDEVVLLKTQFYEDEDRVIDGSVGKIIKRHKSEPTFYKVYFSDLYREEWIMEDNIILLDIYGSPLYKLMREEED